jgi:hypothetical protein
LKPEIFSRPLWSAYKIATDMHESATCKLIDGGDAPYDPKHVNHVFVALSCLDLCLVNLRTLTLARNAINYHIRVVMAMDPSMEFMDMSTPSSLSCVKPQYLAYVNQGSSKTGGH